MEKFTRKTLLFENQIDEKLLSAKELAEKLGCSLSYIKKLRKERKIQPEISFFRFVRYRLSAVVSALKRRNTS